MDPYQVSFVVFLAAPLADGALVAPPTLLKEDFGHFDLRAVRVVALSTLGAGDEPPLQIVPYFTASHF